MESHDVGKSAMYLTGHTGMTDIWNDSCALQELRAALADGAVGATTNPVIVLDVLKKEMDLWQERMNQLVTGMDEATEEEITWALIAEMAVRGAGMLADIFEREQGLKGRLSLQTNPKFYRSPQKMIEQALCFAGLAPNIQVKLPATRAGIQAMEEATYRGVNVNATVCFTLPQAIAVAEAIERGLKRREAEGRDTAKMVPICTIMVGRLDDWLKIVAEKEDIITDPNYLEWAGIAVMKKAYRLFKERGYKSRLLVAAFRNHMHWSSFIGGDIILTIPYQWQKRYNASDIPVVPNIDLPVDEGIIKELLLKFPDFRKAYNEDGMSVGSFATYGATVRTLRSFISAYDELVVLIRQFMLPDPDNK